MRVFAAILLFVSGCKLYFDDDEGGGGNMTPDAGPPRLPDARSPIDAPGSGQCLEPDQRPQDCMVDVTGTVLDYVSRAPYAGGAQVEITTGWDTVPPFPAACPPLQETQSGGDGTVSVTDAVCDSPVYPPILLFMVEAGASDPRAPTATDARLSCTGAECGAWTGELLAPSATIATSWRDQLQAEGMQNATGRGLAFLDFREPDGSPAVGVTPFVRGVTDRQLDAPRELRFLAADRETLVRSDATMTGTSGVAIIALDGVGSALIGGTRGGLSWAPVGVLFADGWLFVEVNQRTP